MSQPKAKKRSRSFLAFYLIVLLVIALIATWFFLPIDSYVAQHSAARKGYTVSSEPEEIDYKYYYNHLKSSSSKEAYNLICSQLPDFPKRIAVPSLSSDEVEEVYTAVSYDNPELFFLGNSCRYLRFGALFYFEPQYIMTKERYEDELTAVEDKATELLNGISHNSSDYEKELYVHDNLAEITDYKTSTVSGSPVYTPYGLLVENEANCEGYARTMQYLMKRLGVVTRVISGTGDTSTGTENHMWNVVTISGKEYNVDPTWDDYIIDTIGGGTSDEPSHIFFNRSKTTMAIDHHPDNTADWENCTHEDLDYFQWNGLLCDSADMATRAVTRTLPSVLKQGKVTLELQFTSKQAYEKAKVRLIDQDRIYTLIAGANLVVGHGNRVSATRIRYNTDEKHWAIRFFFLR